MSAHGTQQATDAAMVAAAASAQRVLEQMQIEASLKRAQATTSRAQALPTRDQYLQSRQLLSGADTIESCESALQFVGASGPEVQTQLRRDVARVGQLMDSLRRVSGCLLSTLLALWLARMYGV